MINKQVFNDRINKAWPKSMEMHPEESLKSSYIEKIKKHLIEQDVCLISHYYVNKDIQALAEQTGGIVADSLEMAKFGNLHPAKKLIIAGVRFMGETAKILSPGKTILMPTLEAECSLDLSCQVDDFMKFREKYPERKVVVYANTSAEIKACADWVVTSSIALDVVEYLDSLGEKIIWGPDKYLGRYIEKQTGADMVHWNGACIVHEEFKAIELSNLKLIHPDAAVLVHPESPLNVIDQADVAGSTSQLLRAAQDLPNKKFIVATDQGIFYKMQQTCPEKVFIPAPTSGNSATCKSCGSCPWMNMNGLKNLLSLLESNSNRLKDFEIHVPKVVREKALISLGRMINFTKN